MTQTDCMDCGEQLQGPYCHSCGQKKSNIHRSTLKLIREVTAEQVSLDSKLTKALKFLIIKPGFLTTEYFAGRRTRYYTPVRLYLLMSVLFFFLKVFVIPANSEVMMQRLDNKQSKIIDSIALLYSKETAAEIRLKGSENPIFQKLRKLRDQNQLSPFIVKIFNRMPTVMFLLLPIFALVLRILFIRHGQTFYYFEHLIFSLHFHSFSFLATSLFIVMPTFPIINVLLALVLGTYLYMAMRQVYGQSHPKTMIKWVLLGGGYSIIYFGSMAIMVIASLIRTTVN